MGIVGDGIEIGTQWIGGEVLFPQSGDQLRHFAGGMLSHPLQDIYQVVIGVDILQAAGHDQGLCPPPASSAPTSVQQKFQFFLPMGITRRARSRWLVSGDTSGSFRNTRKAASRSRA